VDGPVVTVMAVSSGSCLRSEVATAQETTSDVTIKVSALVPAALEPCSAPARVQAYTVQLKRPLGSRALFHAPVTWGSVGG
jgi:hypothetical protein